MGRPRHSSRTRGARSAHRLLACCSAISLLGILAVASPAAAVSGKGPRYHLKIVEGATTLPEFEHPDSVSAGIENSKTEVVLQLIHGGLAIARDSGKNGEGAWISPGPQVGDEVILESPKGTVISTVVYDGLPTIDPTVCAGSTNFSGENSSGEVVEGYYVKNVLETPYHQSTRPVQKAFGEAQVKTLSGTTFGGDFLKPLEIGEDVGAFESLKTSLAGEATYEYASETERPVAGCPAPPPPVIASPLPLVMPPFDGAITKLFSSKIEGLLKFGATDKVTIDEPGTVTQDLYLVGGKLPAFASAHRHSLPPALLLARGSASTKVAGTVTVHLRLTTKGRSKLKSAHKLKVVLITTLRSSSGAKITLGRRSISLHR